MALELAKTVLSELTNVLLHADADGVENFERMIAGAKTVFCHGMGRSGLNGRAFAMRLMHLGMHACLVGDTLAEPIGEGDVLIIVSASGSSKSLIYITRKARACGAKIALITANSASELSAMADCVVCLNAPTKVQTDSDRGSAMPMGTLFEEACYVLFDIVVLELMQKLHISNDDMVHRHANLE